MKENDKNKLIIILCIVGIVIILILNGRMEDKAVTECVAAGNSVEYCERGLLR